MEGDGFFSTTNSTQVKNLPVGIYTLEFHPDYGVFYLKNIGENFSLPKKIYNIEQDFVDRVCKAFISLDSNFGVLMGGIKGTGKSVASKMICNTLKLPVIIIGQDFEKLDPAGFLSAIDQEVVIFIDEFDKIYNTRSSERLLSLMDGAFSTSFKKLFLLTTNTLFVNEYLLNRPGRVRYFKQFYELERDIVIEIIDDLLINKMHKAEILKMIMNLSTVTVDIVKSIVQEVNLFDETPTVFSDFFNVTKNEPSFNVYDVTNESSPSKKESYATVKPDISYIKSCIENETMYDIEECTVRFNMKNVGVFHSFDPVTNILTVIPRSGEDEKGNVVKYYLESVDSINPKYASLLPPFKEGLVHGYSKEGAYLEVQSSIQK